MNSIDEQPSESQLGPILQLYKADELYVVLVQVTYLLGEFPSSPILHNLRGICHIKLGNYDAALESYKALVALDPSDVGSYFNIANILYDEGNFDDAILAYEAIININPVDLDAQYYLEETRKKVSK